MNLTANEIRSLLYLMKAYREQYHDQEGYKSLEEKLIKEIRRQDQERS